MLYASAIMQSVVKITTFVNVSFSFVTVSTGKVLTRVTRYRALN